MHNVLEDYKNGNLEVVSNSSGSPDNLDDIDHYS